MQNAPDITEIRQNNHRTSTETTVTKKKVRPPLLPYCVYGCGGAGRIAANRFAQRHGGDSVVTIDTTRGMTKTEKGVSAFHIGKLNGSGKVRDVNREVIEEFIDDNVSAGDFKDVNIIMCSVSGGSGSVIAPRLIENIIQSGKTAILMCIADTVSEIDCSNSIATLSEIQAMVMKQVRGYLPTILFSNQYTREVVDGGMDEMSDRLVRILTNRYHGSDRKDRYHFLTPMRASKLVKSDMRLLNLSSRGDGEWEVGHGMVFSKTSAQKLDSILTISRKGNLVELATFFHVSSDGYYDIEETPLICSLGYAVPQELNRYLNTKLKAYRAASTEEVSSFGFDDDDMYEDY